MKNLFLLLSNDSLSCCRFNTWRNKSFYKTPEGGIILPPTILAKKDIKPEFQGEYVHPKLIHFVAEWISADYAFKVAELMDSINENIHEQIKRENIEDKPENTKQLFLSSVATICDIM